MDENLQKAKEAIHAYFGDTSRSQDETVAGLEDLASEIEFMIEAINLDS